MPVKWMLDFALDKLQYDEGTRTVSVVSGFDPQTDVSVRDILRPKGFARTDADGYPMNNARSGILNEPHARFSQIRHSDEFDGGSTGYHGSVVRFVYDRYALSTFVVAATNNWQNASSVAVACRDAEKSGTAAP